MEAIELAVFDVAGTTAKDDGLVVEAFTAAAVAMGVERETAQMSAMVDYVQATMGQRKIDVFLHLFDQNLEKAELAHEHFVQAYQDLTRQGALEEFDGVSEMFEELRAQGIGIAITTGFPREILDPIIDSLGWRELIDVSVAASEVAAGRPAPDMILRSLEMYNLLTNGNYSVKNVVVLGDTMSDMQSGVAAGAPMIMGIDSGTHSPEVLFDAGATHVLTDVTQLLTYL